MVVQKLWSWLHAQLDKPPAFWMASHINYSHHRTLESSNITPCNSTLSRAWQAWMQSICPVEYAPQDPRCMLFGGWGRWSWCSWCIVASRTRMKLLCYHIWISYCSFLTHVLLLSDHGIFHPTWSRLMGLEALCTAIFGDISQSRGYVWASPFAMAHTTQRLYHMDARGSTDDSEEDDEKQFFRLRDWAVHNVLHLYVFDLFHRYSVFPFEVLEVILRPAVLHIAIPRRHFWKCVLILAHPCQQTWFRLRRAVS